MLSRGGFELNEIWRRQLAEMDQALRRHDRDRRAGKEFSAPERAAALRRGGKPLEADSVMLAHHAAAKLHAADSMHPHEATAVRTALPHLRQAIEHWSRARHLEDTHGEAIKSPKHPAYGEAATARSQAHQNWFYASNDTTQALLKSGAIARPKATGSWQMDGSAAANIRRKSEHMLLPHVHDLMKDHAPEHRRQLIARMMGHTLYGNTWHWNEGTKHGEHAHWFPKKEGHETYKFDRHADAKDFHDFMKKTGHHAEIEADKITEPDGTPMHHYVHVKPHES